MPRRRQRDVFKEVAAKYVVSSSDGVSNPVTFVEAPWGLNFKLKPAQAFVLKCLYGCPLDDTEKRIPVPDLTNTKVDAWLTETEFLGWMYKNKWCNTDVVEGKNFRELVLVAGRRGGKTTLSSCITNYEMYKLVKREDPALHYGLQKEDEIAVMTVAPTDEQAGTLFNMITNQAARCPFLKDRMLNQTQTYFNLQTDANMLALDAGRKKKRASLLVVAGGCSSNALRGKNNIIVILDEMAFFIDNGGRFSGGEVYRSLKPSLTSFGGDGKIICISSPYSKYGAFWDRYNKSFDSPDDILMFQMHTSLLNPSVSSGILRSEQHSNRVVFMCEYGAEFSDKVKRWIMEEDRFRACIDTDQTTPRRGYAGVRYYMGVDLGIKNDGAAVVVVHRDYDTQKVVVDYSEVWFSGSSDVWDRKDSIYEQCNKYASRELLDIEEIADEIKQIVRMYPVYSGWLDEFNGYGLWQQLQKRGLKQIGLRPTNPAIKTQMYQLLETLIMDGMMDFYDDSVLIPELLLLEVEHTSRRSTVMVGEKPKGNIIVKAPNKPGAHDDLADALARAVFRAWDVTKESKAEPTVSLVGSDGTVVTGAGGHASTMVGYQLGKLRSHGEHPRRPRKSHIKRGRYSGR